MGFGVALPVGAGVGVGPEPFWTLTFIAVVATNALLLLYPLTAMRADRSPRRSNSRPCVRRRRCDPGPINVEINPTDRRDVLHDDRHCAGNGRARLRRRNTHSARGRGSWRRGRGRRRSGRYRRSRTRGRSIFDVHTDRGTRDQGVAGVVSIDGDCVNAIRYAARSPAEA